MGFMLAVLQFNGKTPEAKDVSNNILRGKATTSLTSFKILGCNISGPGDLNTLKLLNFCIIISSIEIYSMSLAYLFDFNMSSLPTSLLKTLEK